MNATTPIYYNLRIMSLSICSLTGQPLRRPVLSTKTGHLYEKEVIEKHLNSFPYCPLTNQPMQTSDLVDIVPTHDTYVRPEQAPSTYLRKIQHEYDLLVVDAFSIRKSLGQTQEELTSSLYQNEAACRVIAKLLKEKQEADAEVDKLQARIAELKNQG